MKYVLISVIVLVLAGGGVAWWYTRDKAEAAAAEANAQQTAKVERQTLRITVDATGAVASNRDVDIKCKASGNIDVLPYKDVSAIVPPGALLMQLDTEDEKRALESANFVVTADKARLDEAKLNLQISEMNLETTTDKDNADLASARAKADDAVNKAKRTKELFDQKLAAQEDLETAQTTAATAQADVKSAEAAIAELDQSKLTIKTKEQELVQMQAQLDQDKSKAETAQQNLDYCTVTAPGPDADNLRDIPKWYVSKMTAGVAIGYLVQSGSSGSSGGTTVMTLSDMSHIFVLATVDESDIGTLLMRFKQGQELPVILTADAYKNVEFRGKVVRIATIGVNTSNVVTFEVKIEVTSPNRDLLQPLMTTNVQIITGERENGLVVPVQAVSFEDNGPTTEQAKTQVADANQDPAADAEAPASKEGATTKPGKKKHRHEDRPNVDDKPQVASVDVLKPDGTIETRDVTVGLTDGTNYEVVSGLQEGETVIIKKVGANSRWRGGRGGANSMMRAVG